jgi:hypothetical protein
LDRNLGDTAEKLIGASLLASRKQDWSPLPGLMEPLALSKDRLDVIAAVAKSSMTSAVLALLEAATPWLATLDRSEWRELSERVRGDHFGVYHLAYYLIGYGDLRGGALKALFPGWTEIDQIEQLRGALGEKPPCTQKDDQWLRYMKAAKLDDVLELRKRLAAKAQS